METPSVIPEHFEPVQDNFPFPCPFILSSVERHWCMKDPLKIIFIKRRHLEENIKAIEQSIGMDEEERRRFLDYWCCPTRHNRSEIRAELDECFDLRQRATSWMDRARPQQEQPKSRIEKYAESAQRFYENAQTQTIPTSPAAAQGLGYADIPDEQ